MGLATVGQSIAIIAGVSLLVFWAAVAVTVTLVARRVRRRYRGTKARLTQVTGSTTRHPRPDPAALRALTAATIGSPAWWSVQRDLHRMWRAVTGAEHAVGVAQKAGAPVGDLPALTRQLADAARGVDAVLRASARTRVVSRDVAVQRDRIEAAAADVQRAAVESLQAMVEADTGPLMSAVRIEVDAVAAGVRSAGYQARGQSAPG